MNRPSGDPRFYSVAAWRRQVSWVGRGLYYVGATEWYLDYQRWKIRFRWWHPVVWLVVGIAFLTSAGVGAYHGIEDGIAGLKLARSPTAHPDTSLRRAPR